MKNRPIRPLSRRRAASLFSGPILLVCASSSIAAEPAGSGITADIPAPAETIADPAQELEMLRTVVVAPLSPDQAIDARHIGERIRWAGGVHHIYPSDDGVCLTILYSLSGDDGAPRWTADPTDQSFKACTAGSYDPELVQDFTNVTIVGTISGKTDIGMGGGSSVGPVVEIEKLYRWSDCLAGETNPVCKRGFLTPQPVTDD